MADDYAQYETQIAEARLRYDQEHIQNLQQEIEVEQQEKSMIREQLDLGEELDRIDFLLRGCTLKDGKWIEPTDESMIVFSEHGVHFIRNTIAWYLNKNTLLSNYDAKRIMEKMHGFAHALNDSIFMDYKLMFKFPSDKECQEFFMEKVNRRVNLKVFCSKLLGKELGDIEQDKIRDNILKELEPRVEKELELIRDELFKKKLTRYLMVFTEIQDSVESCYNRAFGGQERKTLREHAHISENRGGVNISGRSISANGPLGFLKRR
jgi:hypothetical protein